MVSREEEITRWAQITITKKDHATKFGSRTYYIYNKGYEHSEGYALARILQKIGYDTMITSGKMSSTVYISNRS